METQKFKIRTEPTVFIEFLGAILTNRHYSSIERFWSELPTLLERITRDRAIPVFNMIDDGWNVHLRRFLGLPAEKIAEETDRLTQPFRLIN